MRKHRYCRPHPMRDRREFRSGYKREYRRPRGEVSLCAMLLAVSGCTILSDSGPSSLDINSGATQSGPPYSIIKLTPEVVDAVGEWGPGGIAAAFGDKRPPPEITFGIGDVVSVTIFEAAAGGLFIPLEAGVRPGNFVTLPSQPIDTEETSPCLMRAASAPRAAPPRRFNGRSSRPSRTGPSIRRQSSRSPPRTPL